MKKNKLLIDQFIIACISLSFIFHTFIIICIFVLDEKFKNKVSPLIHPPIIINIDVVEVANITPSQTIETNITEEESHPTHLITKIHAPIATPNAKEIKKPSINISDSKSTTKLKSSYGAILSAHIRNHFVNLPQTAHIGENIDVWIKIDNSGNLKEYGILNTHDKIIHSIIEKILLSSSPFPQPPVKYKNLEDIIYKFTLTTF